MRQRPSYLVAISFAGAIAASSATSCSRKSPSDTSNPSGASALPSATPSTLDASLAPASRAAQPAKKARTAKPLTAGERKDFAAAIKEGGKRFNAKDYPGSVESFERAVHVAPYDADALSELGWAAFNAGNFARAEEATRKSLDQSGTPWLRGATLYNLGRIEEQRGARDKAIANYEESLRVRPNKIVLEQLRTLDAARAAAFAPLAATAIARPFRTVEDFCAKARDDSESEEKNFLCNKDTRVPELLSGKTTLEHVPAPYESVEIHYTFEDSLSEDDSGPPDPSGSGLTNIHLLVKTAAGTFATKSLATLVNPVNADNPITGTINRFSIEDVVPGGAPEIVLDLNYGVSNHRDWEPISTSSEDTGILVICGIVQGAQVACTVPTLISQSDMLQYMKHNAKGEAVPVRAGSYDRSFALTYSFAPPGRITFERTPVKGSPMRLPDEVSVLLGAQSVHFQ